MKEKRKTRGNQKSTIHGAAMEAFFKELDAMTVEPEDVDGKIKEYILFIAAYKIYKALFGKEAVALSTARYRIDQANIKGTFEADLCTVPLAQAKGGREGSLETFLNRKNRTLLKEIFTPKAPGAAYLGLNKKVPISEIETALLLRKELDESIDDEDDDW